MGSGLGSGKVAQRYTIERKRKKRRQDNEETLQLPNKNPLLLFVVPRQQEGEEAEEKKRGGKEFMTNLKPEPVFLHYTKYVGGSGQTIALSQVLCKGVFQIMSLCTDEPFL